MVSLRNNNSNLFVVLIVAVVGFIGIIFIIFSTFHYHVQTNTDEYGQLMAPISTDSAGGGSGGSSGSSSSSVPVPVDDSVGVPIKGSSSSSSSSSGSSSSTIDTSSVNNSTPNIPICIGGPLKCSMLGYGSCTAPPYMIACKQNTASMTCENRDYTSTCANLSYVGSCAAVGCTEAVQCTSGICCNTNTNTYQPSSFSCSTTAIFSCTGQNVLQTNTVQYCSGLSASCSGSTYVSGPTSTGNDCSQPYDNIYCNEGASSSSYFGCTACSPACNSLPHAAAGTCVSGGQCTGTNCVAGWYPCVDGTSNNANGCETDIYNDVSNCGSCGNICGTANVASRSCNSGTCSISCNSGWANCDGVSSNGCEVNLAGSFPNNCGSCGHSCNTAADSGCYNGNCIPRCTSNSFYKCLSNKLYWYDSCNVQGGLYQDCGAGGCVDGSNICCVANSGKSCDGPSNSCGQKNIGSYSCSGVCSATTAPSNPAGYGTGCTSAANNCGQTNSGMINCAGVCSASKPADQSIGQSCGSCSGKVLCGGSCSIATPGNYGNSCTAGSGSCQRSGNIGCNGCNAVAGVPYTWYRDVDGDGYGNPSVTTLDCTQPSGYVSNNLDCNDANSSIHPGANEVCGNGVDDNCNGQVDEGDVCLSTIKVTSSCSGSASATCGIGACKVTMNRTCNNGVWSDCIPGNPSTEICGNNIDDNCNGQIDETCECISGTSVSCSVSNSIGTCTGTKYCYAGSYRPCSARTPTGEICGNNIDDDCDGFVDEGCICTPGETKTCGSNVGECSYGYMTCGGTSWGPCVHGVNPTTEICNGKDDDCDGVVDNGFNVGASCGSCGGVNICSNGVAICSVSTPSNFSNTCFSVPNSCGLKNSGNIQCNGLCNATVPSLPTNYSNVCSVGVGVCKRNGTITCSGSCSVSAGSPNIEICNGLDDNCNGIIDENLTVNLSCTVSNGVGVMSQSCVNRILVNGSCLVSSCNTNYTKGGGSSSCISINSYANGSTFCGNGVLDANEQCDRGSLNTNAVCDASISPCSYCDTSCTNHTVGCKDETVNSEQYNISNGIALRNANCSGGAWRWSDYNYSCNINYSLCGNTCYADMKSCSVNGVVGFQNGSCYINNIWNYNSCVITVGSTCIDSDGPNNYNVSGHVSGTANNIDFNESDYCVDNFTVADWRCNTNGSGAIADWYKCSNGCKDGACLRSKNAPNICTDSDGGQNLYLRGTLNITNAQGVAVYSNTDSCYRFDLGNVNNCSVGEGQCTVMEYYCADNDGDGINESYASGAMYNGCPFGCKDGACISSTTPCYENWSCSSWSSCNGTQARTCIDLNRCGTELSKPPVSQTCTNILSNCSDNIMNGGETGVDCGGPCATCATCTDNIQNQGETGVDCGGPCIPCVMPQIPVGENKKDMSRYSAKEAFLISDNDWKSVLSLVPLTTWSGSEGCNKGYGTPSNVCVYPTLIYHDETGGFDADSIIYFMQQYSTQKVIISGQTSKELDNLLVASPETGAGIGSNNIKRIYSGDYLSYWSSYKDVVYIEDNYELAIVASTYASLIDAPLIIKGTPLDVDSVFNGRNVICVGDVKRTCNEHYTLDQLQKKYVDNTNTDKIMLVNPDDLSISVNEQFQPEKSSKSVYELYGRTSLAAPLLASAKHEIILTTKSSDYNVVDSSIDNKLSGLNIPARFLTIIGSPPAIPMTRPLSHNTPSYIEGTSQVEEIDSAVYGNIGNDNVIELATGRLFGITISDVTANINRDLFTDQISSSNNFAVLWSQRNPNEFDQAKTMDFLLENNGMTKQSVYINIFDTPKEFKEERDLTNKRFISFLGDGYTEGWDKGISVQNMRDKSIWLEPSLVTSEACLTSSYDKVSLKNRLFATNIFRRGALAHIGAVDPSGSPALTSDIYQYMSEGMTIGEALKNYKNNLVLYWELYETENNYGAPNLVYPLQETFYILLGDPTIDFGLTKTTPIITSSESNNVITLTVPQDNIIYHIISDLVGNFDYLSFPQGSSLFLTEGLEADSSNSHVWEYDYTGKAINNMNSISKVEFTDSKNNKITCIKNSEKVHSKNYGKLYEFNCDQNKFKLAFFVQDNNKNWMLQIHEMSYPLQSLIPSYSYKIYYN